MALAFSNRNRLRLHVAIIATVAGVTLFLNTGLNAPPRFDGAGYAVLARSILAGSGYRAIDHPDAPRHAHFPPGYPLVLAGLWAVTGPSNVSAHLLSIACTIGATLLAFRLFRSWFGWRVGFILGLALAMNWRWSRDGSAIQSEPLFLLVSLAAVAMSRRINSQRAVVLGLLLGFGVLVRHVGISIAAAVLLELLLRKKTQAAMIAGATAAIVVSPWVAWLLRVGHETQVELLPGRKITHVFVENAIFYVRRLPDQIFGPIIEVATVFRPSWSKWATADAAILSAGILFGWICLGESPRKHIAGLIPFCTLALLVIWPFTEAGRFLVPLIPFILAGSFEGLRRAVGWLGSVLRRLPVDVHTRQPTAGGGVPTPATRSRVLAAWLVLAISLPYSIYAIASGRAEAGRRSHQDFDRACEWIAHQDKPGTILTRHPGEAYLLTGRKAMSPLDGASNDMIDDLIRDYDVIFLLIDEARYAKAPTTPLETFVVAHPDRVEPVHGDGSVAVYKIKPG